MKSKKRMIQIAVVCVAALVVGVLLYLFIPVKSQEQTTVPAVMFQKGTDNIEYTTLSINGEWSKKRVTGYSESFKGEIQVDALEYTKAADRWDVSIDFVTDKEWSYILGGYITYFDSKDKEEFGWLYTNEEHDIYTLDTGLVDSDEEYVVIAPAETVEEAYAICDQLGLSYPN